MIDRKDQSLGRFLELERAALAEMPRHQTPQTYFRWARETLPQAFPSVFIGESPDDNEKLAFWIARGLWSNAPLPARKFRPKPLPEPKRNDSCPCGSGRKFKACCSRFPTAVGPPRLDLWPAFVRSQPEEYWLQAAAQLPTVGVASVGRWLMERQRWKPLVELLEPRFADGQRITSEHADFLHWLCEAYEQLPASSAKGEALAARLADCPNKAVRARANLRLATELLSRDDSEGAWSAWRKAEKATPSSSLVALVELSMLAEEKQYERAKRRAGFWLTRLAGDPELSEQELDTLLRFKDDPRGAWHEVGDDEGNLLPADLEEALVDLLDWTHAMRHRPLPDLEWQPLEDADDALRGACSPVLDAAATALERSWRERTGVEKPFSIDLTSGEDDEALTRIADWLPWLKEHPEALDSFSILDDLARLLFIVEDVVDPTGDFIDDLVERGYAMLAKHWPEERAGTIPWVIEDNRPALRLLSHGIDGEDWHRRNEPRLRLYLRLNPNDNHGFRTDFVNRLLIDADDAEAVEVASRYPKDMFAEVVYGHALGLYRLRRMAEAEAPLARALDRLPLVAEYLLAEDVDEPKLDERGMVIGGDQQAWLYRQAMRGEWQKTPGALEWMAARRKAGGVRA